MHTDSINKKKIFIQANCQSNVIKNIFLTLERLEVKYDILPIKPVHLWKDENKVEIFKKIQEADIFLHQPIFEKNFGIFASDNLLNHLKDNAQVISFPNLYFTGYHPQAMYLTDEDSKKVDGPFDYHDKNIVDAYKDGQSVEDVKKIFLDEDFYSPKEVELNVEQSLKDLEGREKFTSIKMSPIIRNKMKEEKLFHIFNHPTNEIIFILVNKILEKLGDEPLINQEMQRFPNEMLGQIQFPVYKSVQKHFDIKEEKKLLYLGEEYLLNKMIMNYFTFYDSLDFLTRGQDNRKKNNFNKDTINSGKINLNSVEIESIPQVIMQYWNNEEINEDVKALMETWKIVNRDFEYKLFHQETAYTYLAENYNSDIAELFNTIEIPAMQSDFFRVAFLLNEGGIYLDAASKCLVSIGEWLDLDKNLIVMRKWHGRIINGFIAAKKNNPFLNMIFERIIKNVVNVYQKDKKINVWEVTGPKIFIDALDKHDIMFYEKYNISIIEQLKHKKYFDFVNDLEHKNESHWSKI